MAGNFFASHAQYSSRSATERGSAIRPASGEKIKDKNETIPDRLPATPRVTANLGRVCPNARKLLLPRQIAELRS
jgi:hypothetical protein